MDAFDADVLIYAADPSNQLGRPVWRLFPPVSAEDPVEPVGVGSVLLLPEVLSKPYASGEAEDSDFLEEMLGRLDLRPVTRETARFAAGLGSRYGLGAVDAVHLATALDVGADRFITNNRRHFPKTIDGIAITYPEDVEDLDDPEAGSRRL
jgi:predicted nucleic acid-binding protein